MGTALKWIGVVALCVVIVGMAAFLGPRLAGTTEVPTDMGRVSIKVTPSLSGGLEGYVPVADWGVRFEGPPVPYRVRAELRSLDRESLLRVAEGDSGVIAQTRSDLRRGAIEAALRTIAWSVGVLLVLLVVAMLLVRGPGPRWALPAIGIGLFATVAVITGAVARSSVDRGTFESPTFFASGTELRRILEVVDQAEVQSQYGSEFESIVRSIGAVLSTGQGPVATGPEMYVGSDLHANPLVIRPVSRLVGNQPLLMVGDFGQRGSAAESALLVPRVAALGDRVIAVSGNHDSMGLMRKLAAAGVTVLDQRGTLQPDGRFQPPPVVNVSGVLVAGWSDPFEYGGDDPLGDRAVTTDDLEDPDAAVAGWLEDMIRWFDSLDRKPDVVMVHQNSLASLLAEGLFEAGYRAPLTIATGHSHQQRLEKVGTIIVVNAGTIGAGGAFDAGRAEIGMAHLRFEETGALRSAELIAVEPFSGGGRATRVVVDSLCPEEVRCSADISEELAE